MTPAPPLKCCKKARGLPAVWVHAQACDPGDEWGYCDEHARTPCSCNEDEDGKQYREADGRLFPCVDFDRVKV